MERSKVTFRQWVFAIYLEVTSLKVVSSMKMTGSFINIRAGPCTDYEILGQVQEGHRLHLMGRNASENQMFGALKDVDGEMIEEAAFSPLSIHRVAQAE
ncbi:MAG: SH3 domain-containing protein [Caldilineaceae bacterium SB0661_bin_34]|nr:SH3 domain-containing protein [Caldilineaceae bacterium SB0661_bin_34]